MFLSSHNFYCSRCRAIKLPSTERKAITTKVIRPRGLRTLTTKMNTARRPNSTTPLIMVDITRNSEATRAIMVEAKAKSSREANTQEDFMAMTLERKVTIKVGNFMTNIKAARVSLATRKNTEARLHPAKVVKEVDMVMEVTAVEVDMVDTVKVMEVVMAKATIMAMGIAVGTKLWFYQPFRMMLIYHLTFKASTMMR